MYIQEIILEGFKSYATRTVITGWDSEFNAITGLNGSGKSNILDAICFVLGIENLRQVRATTLQDLVYKRGQAGITKASVTIVFNNEDSSKSPVGFSEHKQITVTRQVVVGGKNKYLVNGHNAQSKLVENLFQSVQLNINNPHFLIMQGQITKVLNMKPVEILAMIEETAGTRMFEDRRLKALNTMDKKERKVEEIEALLTDVIGPKLNGLRTERTEFVEYKRAEAEIEKLAKFLAAYDYYSHGKAKIVNQAELDEANAALATLDQESRANRLELEELEDKIMTLTKQKQFDAKQSHKLKELEHSLKESENELVRIQAQVNLLKQSRDEEETGLAKQKSRLETEGGNLKKQKDIFAKSEKELKKRSEAFETMKVKLDQDKELLQSLSTGISSSGHGSGYEKLTEDINIKISSASTRIQQSEQKIKSVEESLESMKEEVGKAKKDSQGSTKKIDLLKQELESLEQEKRDIRFDVNEEKQLESRCRELEGKIRDLTERIDQLKGAVSSVHFSYSDPVNGFDRSLVKGTVAELVTISDPKYTNALEITAGGRLYNVVVEDEKVANQLLEKGKLARRVTIIPLNKILARPIPEEKAALASQLTHGKARVGLSLVSCDGDVLNAIKYIFGNSFICDDKEAASLVAFDRRIGNKAVSLEGDVYEPSGTLSGGSNPSSGSILSKLSEFKNLHSEQAVLMHELESMRAQLDSYRSARRKAADLEQRCDLKRHELSILERQLSQKSSGKLISQYEALLVDFSNLNNVISEALKEKEVAEKELKRIEKEMSEFSSNREGKLVELEKLVNKELKDLEKERKAYDDTTSSHCKLSADIEVLEKVLADLTEAIEQKERELVKMNEELSSMQSAFYETQTQHIGIKVKYESEMQHLRQYDEQLKSMEAQKQQLLDSIEQSQIDKKTLQANVASLIGSVQKVESLMTSLKSKHPWIKDSEQLLGKEGAFDFAKENIPDCRKRLNAFEEQHSKLRKTINFNVMDMIDRIEAKETALKQMLGTVKKDRKKIEETIVTLDDYKLDTLMKTYEKVNADFGAIFAELLPGSFAKLEPMDGQSITDGLEIKVQLGGVWKASLTELSGGQRSVIALSLILSLLQFKPAPMYILDEVDAALDLSHTENIGSLLKNRFKGSQFIVVSLKEGMFDNANVLFKTRFKDGISSVERTEHVSNSKKTSGPAKTKARPGIVVPKQKSALAVG